MDAAVEDAPPDAGDDGAWVHGTVMRVQAGASQVGLRVQHTMHSRACRHLAVFSMHLACSNGWGHVWQSTHAQQVQWVLDDQMHQLVVVEWFASWADACRNAAAEVDWCARCASYCVPGCGWLQHPKAALQRP